MEPGSTFKETRGTLEVEVFSHSDLTPGETVGFASGPCKGCEEFTEGDYAEGDEDDWWCGACWNVEKYKRAQKRIAELEDEVEKLKEYLNTYSRRESETEEKLEWYEWYRGGDSGISSETIFEVMTGIPVRSHDYPYDVDDFGRCSRLLERFPRWRDRLEEVSDRFPRWKPFVDNWSTLESLYESKDFDKCYVLLKGCRHYA